MLDAVEFGRRLGEYNGTMRMAESELQQAGCEVNLFKSALARSQNDLLDLLSVRYFRGRMPAAVRAGYKAYAVDPWMVDVPLQHIGAMFEAMALTPQFAAIR